MYSAVLKILYNKKTYSFFQLWLVSDCSFTLGAKKRLEISDEMIKSGLKIDRFGDCFGKANPFPRGRNFWKSLDLLSSKQTLKN